MIENVSCLVIILIGAESIIMNAKKRLAAGGRVKDQHNLKATNSEDISEALAGDLHANNKQIAIISSNSEHSLLDPLLNSTVLVVNCTHSQSVFATKYKIQMLVKFSRFGNSAPQAHFCCFWNRNYCQRDGN